MAAGAASGASGAEIGASIGMVASPLGGIAGGILGGLIGAATGGIAGSKLGEAVDKKVLNNYECLNCGYEFSASKNLIKSAFLKTRFILLQSPLHYLNLKVYAFLRLKY